MFNCVDAFTYHVLQHVGENPYNFAWNITYNILL